VPARPIGGSKRTKRRSKRSIIATHGYVVVCPYRFLPSELNYLKLVASSDILLFSAHC